MELHYVATGDVINWHIINILDEAKQHGYDISVFSEYGPIKASDVNQIIDWLVRTFPNEYSLDKETV